MNREAYFARLEPTDIIVRATASDGALFTFQHYRNLKGQRDGLAWACHACPEFGTHGEWGPWNEHFYTTHPDRYTRIDHGGTVTDVQCVASQHAHENHGGGISADIDLSVAQR